MSKRGQEHEHEHEHEKGQVRDHPLDFIQMMYEQSSEWDDVQRLSAKIEQEGGPTAEYKMVTGEGGSSLQRATGEENLGHA